MRTCTTALGLRSPLPSLLLLSHLQGNSLVIQILLRASWKMQIHVFQAAISMLCYLASRVASRLALSAGRAIPITLLLALDEQSCPMQNLSFLQNCWGVVLFLKSKYILAQSWLHFRGEVVPFCEYSLKCACAWNFAISILLLLLLL